MANETTVIHVTHEAAGKIGGIGAVLQGFFTSESYLEAIERSIIVGPLFSTDADPSKRLGEDGQVLYSSMDGIVKTGHALAFHELENQYNAAIVYGTRKFLDKRSGLQSDPEILLIDVRCAESEAVNELKRKMYEEFGIRSDLYEHLWEYEQYVRLAPVAIAVLKELGIPRKKTLFISHEFMGMPTALAAILDRKSDFKTAFYAHEVATMRRIVEHNAGHDTMFYNVIERAVDKGLFVDEVFGDQSDFFKHPLIEAARHCDRICAVGDYVEKELRFLSDDFKTANIDIVYNGIPAYEIDISEKLKSKAKLQQYCDNLLGYKPDFIFTHVTRLVQSKGLWRDLRILEHLETEFKKQKKTGVMFLLSTEVGQRRNHDIRAMEENYKWPVAHREGMPDLSGGEANFYAAIQEFNAKSKNIKIIFVNQFGFDTDSCGNRMPEDMEFMDIRKGSDVEFGMSIYEPFGIAQLEPLSFGGICVVSNICGCAGFVQDVDTSGKTKNVIIADYVDLTKSGYHKSGGNGDIKSLMKIDRSLRNSIEDKVSERTARQIYSQLPKTTFETEKMIRSGYELARNMSWEVVMKDYLLSNLDTLWNKEPIESESVLT